MKAIFWADQKAEEIAGRKKFHYLDKDIPKFDKYTIKTSASISGVLHIGRLSDTIRGESVCRALLDRGMKAELIWVAEDMDPLRKIPEGVPKKFEAYIGAPVTDIPDPLGCHKTYAEHHIEEYMKTIHEFVSLGIVKYSMRDEYRRGNFGKYIEAMLKNLDEVRKIQEKYRGTKLPPEWIPWAPVCSNCGKIITTKVTGIDEGAVTYRCEDYQFETKKALGCGHEGTNDPLRDAGKMMWKGEWAAQWARWKVSSEGAGKEYVVPTSAWWVNAEIVERILKFPMPVPIFYEHLMIDGKKMSASLGNVVYPREWLDVAPPELLRFFYNKKLMKTRSFSWKNLPMLYDDYDLHAGVYYGKGNKNERERKHMERLYEISQLGDINRQLNLSFSHAAVISQFFKDRRAIIESLKRLGIYDEKTLDDTLERIELAGNWVQKHAPEEQRINLDVDIASVRAKLNDRQKSFLGELAGWLEGERSAEQIHEKIYEISKEMKLPGGDAFQAVYIALLDRREGPKAGAFIASLDRDWVVKRFVEVSK